jgi:arginyl-tRNA--protein-N-Asp/Glu arginylyltransferase
MYPPEREQYESFLNDGLGCANYYRLYQGNRLVAVTVADKCSMGWLLSTRFSIPDQPQRSLGTEAILLQIRQAQAWACLLFIWGTGSMGVARCLTSHDLRP